MNVQIKNIPVNKETMKAEIDVRDNTVIYIVDKGGTVQSIPLPSFGVIEIPCQNYKVGNPSYRITLKRE